MTVASFDVRADECARHGKFEVKSFEVLGRVIRLGCPSCAREQDQADERDKAGKDAAERQSRLQARLDGACVPSRFREKSFDGYATETQEQIRAKSIAVEFAKNWIHHRERGSVLIFSGKPGTGKTHLALAIGQQVLNSDTVLYLSAADAIRAIRETWRKESARSESQVMRDFATVGLLILDEIGMQHGTESEKVHLFDIIDKRYRESRPFILLTNQNSAGLQAMLGDRSYDRLREAGRWVTFDWESYRGKK